MRADDEVTWECIDWEPSKYETEEFWVAILEFLSN